MKAIGWLHGAGREEIIGHQSNHFTGKKNEGMFLPVLLLELPQVLWIRFIATKNVMCFVLIAVTLRNVNALVLRK